LQNLSVDESIILERISKGRETEIVDWIHLAQDRVQWRAIVNAVINVLVS